MSTSTQKYLWKSTITLPIQKLAKMIYGRNFFSSPDVVFYIFLQISQSNYLPILHVASLKNQQKLIILSKSWNIAL